MRVGSNPNRLVRAQSFAPVALCVVVHLPHFDGYHAGRMEVLQTCLRSMTEHADMDCSLLIWDNGSHPSVREWMRDEMRPDVLVESINVGKARARYALMHMLPPRTIAAYSDDDMYFYPGWLAPQIELLKHFPGAACVTGYPVRTAFRWGTARTREWASANAKLEYGRFLPDEWEGDFSVSIGRSVETHRAMTALDSDWRITYRGVQAYATSHHCQMVGYSDVLGSIPPWDERAMSDEKPFDVALDEIGLRLATTERYTRHIGNVLHDELRHEIQAQDAHSTGV